MQLVRVIMVEAVVAVVVYLARPTIPISYQPPNIATITLNHFHLQTRKKTHSSYNRPKPHSPAWGCGCHGGCGGASGHGCECGSGYGDDDPGGRGGASAQRLADFGEASTSVG